MRSYSCRAFWSVMCLLLLLTNCNQSTKKDFVIATGPVGTSNYELGNAIIETFNNGLKYQVQADSITQGSLARAKALKEGEVDFALVQNDIVLPDSSTHDLRTVLRLYPQVLFIVYPPTVKAATLQDLFAGRRIGVGPHDSGVQPFLKRLCEEFNIDTTTCKFIYTSYEENVLNDSIEISCSLTGFNNARIRQMVNQGARIWNFDSLDRLGRGASVDGFCMKYLYAQPYVLPMRLYGDYPIIPIVTLAVDNILITNEKTDDVVVYDFIQYLLTNREALANKNALFTALPVNEGTTLSRFPLHDGVRQYYDRDRPTFFERYSDLLALALGIVTILSSAYLGFYQLRRQISERRLDKFRFRLLDLQRKLEFTYDLPTLLALEQHLRSLWKEMIEAARTRKIKADKEFEVLRTLFKETEDELHHKRMETEQEEEA